jgi:hypothetical protein
VRALAGLQCGHIRSQQDRQERWRASLYPQYRPQFAQFVKQNQRFKPNPVGKQPETPSRNPPALVP